MASTISNAALTVTVTETLNINGSNHGSERQMTISGVNEVSKRIMTITTTGTQIFKGHATLASFGQYIDGNIKYIRVTNLDDTNSVAIHIEDTTNTTYAQILIPAGHVFFLTDAASSYGDGSSAAIPTGNIERIDAIADTDSVDVELMVASS